MNQLIYIRFKLHLQVAPCIITNILYYREKKTICTGKTTQATYLIKKLNLNYTKRRTCIM